MRLDLDEAVRQTLTRLESAEAMLADAPWREFFRRAPARRLTVLKQCLEAVLAGGRREDFIQTATRLETAYAISAGDERVTARRDEIALIAAIRANSSNTPPGQRATAREHRARHSAASLPRGDGRRHSRRIQVGRSRTDRTCLSPFGRISRRDRAHKGKESRRRDTAALARG